MSFRLIQHQQLKCILDLSMTGGLTDTVFPRTERKLNRQNRYIDYQKALKFVIGSKRFEDYESVMDFIFCETFTDWRTPCQEYYRGNEVQLKDHLSATPSMLAVWDMILCDRVLEHCLKTYLNKSKTSWNNMFTKVDTKCKLLTI